MPAPALGFPSSPAVCKAEMSTLRSQLHVAAHELEAEMSVLRSELEQKQGVESELASLRSQVQRNQEVEAELDALRAQLHDSQEVSVRARPSVHNCIAQQVPADSPMPATPDIHIALTGALTVPSLCQKVTTPPCGPLWLCASHQWCCTALSCGAQSSCVSGRVVRSLSVTASLSMCHC